MTKAQIVEEIYERLGLTKKDIARVIDLFFEIVKEGLKSGEHIELRGFGTFEVKTREEREARNPKTGDSGKSLNPSPKRKSPDGCRFSYRFNAFAFLKSSPFG